MNIFESAVRQKFRFPSTKGELSTEQLFDLPLTSRTQFDLDNVARALSKQLRELGEESFVERDNPQRQPLQQKLDLVKYIIETRIAENAARVAQAKRAQEVEQLEALLDQKKAQSLMSLSQEEIEKRLAAARAGA